VTLEQATAAIRVGMSATATIVVDEVSNVLRIPNRFITLDRRTQRAFVTVQDADGTVEQIEVQLGKRNETYSEILAGVNEGDELVLLPRSFLSSFGVAP
jgi:HlyD family secretion protein